MYIHLSIYSIGKSQFWWGSHLSTLGIRFVLSFSLRSVACLKLSIKSHSHVSIVGICLANAIRLCSQNLSFRLGLLLCSRYQSCQSRFICLPVLSSPSVSMSSCPIGLNSLSCQIQFLVLSFSVSASSSVPTSSCPSILWCNLVLVFMSKFR